jgi:glucose uptake protein
MLCWGSWANTQKLAGREWRFQLFYWDYAFGVFLLSLALAFTLGSHGQGGRPFLADLAQADRRWLWSAFAGGVIFNLSNILLVAAIDMLTLGVGGVVVAIILDALAYRRLTAASGGGSTKGIVLSIIAGVLMGFFYSYVARAIGSASTVGGTTILEAGKLSPYSAIVLFSLGLLLSNFLWNTIVMAKPFVGEPVPFGDYFRKGNLGLHLVGILGGAIWNLGMALSILAGGRAGPALSYGLGQGATMIGALWGVFVWKEFKNSPPGTTKYIVAMFVFYVLGLATLICSQQ